MVASNYNIGQVVRLSATFTSTAAALADPTKVTYTVEDPSGNNSTDTDTGIVAHPSTGLYTLDVQADEAGVWNYKVNSTGVVQASGEGWFRVKHSKVST